MAEKRDNFVEFWIGHNRTGKSVNLRDAALAYKKRHKKKKIIAFDPQGRFKDIADSFIFEENWEKYFDESGQKLLISDTYFILDDYRALMERDTTNRAFVKMLMLRNEHGLDFSMVCHSPKFIIERISYYVTHINLFYSSGGDESFRSSGKIANIETIMQCRNIINHYVTNWTKGLHASKSPSGKHTFPFIRLDFEDEVLSLLNMPKATIKGKDIEVQENKQKESVASEAEPVYVSESDEEEVSATDY